MIPSDEHHFPPAAADTTPDLTADHHPISTAGGDNTPSAGLPAVPGFAVSREIARGGMGVVYAAHDPTFEREVAIKVMHPGQDAARFVVESKVTAQLPHPGIPPVYTLGALADGRPFLAMKLIEGRTLAAELKASGRPDLPRLLGIFQRICETVGYAHARSIIHRDLKPSNVMVGAFGEVLVVDWGLAKSGFGNQEAETREGDRRSDLTQKSGRPTSETMDGQAKGSPPFMAPEQARGEWERVDARADVFALGGILCALLTGQPPFARAGFHAVIRQAGNADLSDALARLDACGADAELVALCKWCLAPDPVGRPADGNVVAGAVAAYRTGVEDRARRAESARAAAEARSTEERKRRRVQLALLGSALLLLVAIGGFAWWQDKQASRRDNERSARQAAAEREATASVAEVTALCDLGDREVDDPPRWRQTLTAARAAARRAEAAVASGPVSEALSETVRGTIARVERDEADCETAERVDKFLIQYFNEPEFGPRNERSLPTTFAGVFTRVGLHDISKNPNAASEIRGHRLSYRLTILVVLLGQLSGPEYTALAEQLTRPKNATLVTILDTRLRKSTGRIEALLDSPEGRRLTSSDLVLTALHLSFVATGDTVDLLRSLSSYEELLDESVRRNPRDLIAHLHRQSLSVNANSRFVAPGQPQPASLTTLRHLASGAAALTLRPDMPYLWSKHGIALEGEDQPHWAMSCYRRAVELDPSRLEDLGRLARCQAKVGDHRAAVETCRQVIRELPPTAPVLANDLRAEVAAVALSSARSKQGKGQADASEQAHWRGDARRWLTASLGRWREESESGTGDTARVVRGAMHSWLRNEHFSHVRDAEALRALAPEERTEWEHLWASVRALALEAEKKATPVKLTPSGEFVPVPPPPVKVAAPPLPPVTSRAAVVEEKPAAPAKGKPKN